MQDPTLINNRGFKEPYKGRLLKTTKSGIVDYKFNYSQLYSRKFEVGTSHMPLDFVAVTETIMTSNIDLSFVRGDKVVLYDERTMTVQAIEYEYNNAKASMGIDGRERAIITLEGGGA